MGVKIDVIACMRVYIKDKIVTTGFPLSVKQEGLTFDRLLTCI